MPDRNSEAFDCNSWFVQEILPLESSLRAYLHACFPSLLSEADDVVQESFLRISQAKMAGKLRSPKGFLFRAARNAAIDVFRRGRATSLDALMETDDPAVAEDGPAVSEKVSRHEEVDVLIQAIETLPGRCRETLELCKFGGLSHKEVGIRLGISARTVNVQIVKGVSRCAEYLEARGFKARRLPNEKVELHPATTVRGQPSKRTSPRGFVRDLAA